MWNFKKSAIIIVSVVSLGCVAFGVYHAVHSDLFILQSLEISSSVDDPPLDDSAVTQLAAIPLGTLGLFSLNLKPIEARLLANELIQGVKLQKRFPNSLQLDVTYREPQAIVQLSKGLLAYVDASGKIYGSVNLTRTSDLPFLSGFGGQGVGKIKEALILLNRWEQSPLNRLCAISSIVWDSERGFRVLGAYTVDGKVLDLHAGQGSRVRTMIDIGQEIASNLDGQLFRLQNVMKYLNRNSIAVRQIWADAGKKVVVKTVQGS